MALEDAMAESNARILCVFLSPCVPRGNRPTMRRIQLFVSKLCRRPNFTLTCSYQVRKEVKRYVLEKALRGT